jgi:outer membrane protein W
VGRTLSTGASCFFSRYFGAGVDYSYFTASNYIESAVLTDLETGRLMGQGVMQDDIGLHVVGPVLLLGYLMGSGNMFFILHLAPVRLFYNDRQQLMDKIFTVEGRTYGFKTRFSFDYRILEFLGLGIDISDLYSPDAALTVNGKSGIIQGKETLNSMIYSVGLKFYL